jgi:hypothetical protein
MVELRFRIRNSVFNVQEVPSRRATIRPLSLCLPSVEEAALLGEVDESGRVIPRRGVFFTGNLRTGPVIEGFEDCALGEFVKAQIEALSQNGEPPAKCEVHGLDPFELAERMAERLRDRSAYANSHRIHAGIRRPVLKESGFLDSTLSSASNAARLAPFALHHDVW